MKRPFQNESRPILLRLMKISFLKVKERSRALENKKNQTQTQANTQHPNQSTYLLKLTKRPFQNESRPILLRLMKISFLKVKERSRALENKKNQPKPKPTPNTQTKAPTF